MRKEKKHLQRRVKSPSGSISFISLVLAFWENLTKSNKYISKKDKNQNVSVNISEEKNSQRSKKTAFFLAVIGIMRFLSHHESKKHRDHIGRHDRIKVADKKMTYKSVRDTRKSSLEPTRRLCVSLQELRMRGSGNRRLIFDWLILRNFDYNMRWQM